MKYADNSWDFRNENTKEYTHCYHSYPAMMIPQVARRVIKRYGGKASLLFDPYCGTGTSLVEANLAGINAIGTDLNPLARLVAKSKNESVNIELIEEQFNRLNEIQFERRFNLSVRNDVKIPDFPNIDFWFSKEVQEQLAIIKQFIGTINNDATRRFFLVAFSETVRKSSYTRESEFKLIRMPEPQRKRYKPDVFEIILTTLQRNIIGLKAYLKVKPNGSYAEIYDFNTVEETPNGIIKDNTVDIVVTSPPYGDSRTTVAYGQYSRLANQWMGVKYASQIDKMLMGGVKNGTDTSTSSKTANEIIHQIRNIDANRSKDVVAFFVDYERSINNVSKLVRKGGYVCYVVGNRTVRGIRIKTDLITRELFENQGFEHIETIIRNIPNKRMPSKNSPTNIVGKKASTMKNEFIVICKK